MNMAHRLAKLHAQFDLLEMVIKDGRDKLLALSDHRKVKRLAAIRRACAAMIARGSGVPIVLVSHGEDIEI